MFTGTSKIELLNISKGFVLGIAVILGMSAIAWNGPVSAPPNYNAYAPINISSASQTKSGALWAGSFLTEGGGYFGGNVGIGTSNPSQKLDVVGNANVSGSFSANSGSITNNLSANTLQLNNIVTEDSSCGSNGLIARDVNGRLIYCESGIWQGVNKYSTNQTFNNSGIWWKPAGVKKVSVKVIGGGGGGSDSDANISGENGGTSSFGSYCSATGGVGGLHNGPGGSGGYGVGGDTNYNGGNGGSNGGAAGLGAFSIGAGNGGTGNRGGAGGGGGGCEKLIDVSSSSSVSVTVGQGGANGVTTSTGGVVIVEEYY